MMKMLTFQWLSLVQVIWMQSINGTNSNFPAYSSQLKQLLSLSQLQLNNLALASDAGKLFGWLAGLALIYQLPLWLVLIIGSSLGFIGYGVQYLFLTHRITCLSYSQIFFLTTLAGNGICWINTVSYVLTIHNFPFHRQAAVGLTSSYFGLSAVIYTTLVDALSSNPFKKAQQYMLLNSVLPLLVSIVTAPSIRYIYSSSSNMKATKVEAGLLVLLLITISTGIYAVTSSLSRRSTPWVNVVGLGACLTTPLIIPLAHCVGGLLDQQGSCFNVNREGQGQDRARVVDENICTTPTPTPTPKEEKEEICAIEEIGVKLMVKRLNFWLYFLIYLSGATLGLVYVNNLGQIAESRGYSNITSLVSLSSAFLFFGRLLPSLLDYIYSRCSTSGYMVPGPTSIVVVMVPMAGAFFLLLNGTNLCLHVSTSIIGFSTGLITSVSVSTTSELFGSNNFGLNHNVVVANIPLGSFIFGDLAAFVYRKHGDTNGRCMGLQCYRMTFITWGTLCSVGTLLALALHFRTRNFYYNSLRPRLP